MTSEPAIVAIIAAHNEADIIAACLRHLHANRVDTYLLDDGSTDGTVRIAEAFLGRGLLAIERLPALTPPRFSLDRILERKEALATELDADWFINHDADEFRESLWADHDLRSAIGRVDRLGWNAVDFQIFAIPPVGDPATATAVPDQPPQWFAPGADCDREQIRAWKRQPRVDLRSSAGHGVKFDGRRIFPMRFPMRHYPVRSQAHGERKLFVERVPRYDTDERARGWHVQYRTDAPGRGLIADSADLEPYDITTARIISSLANRDVEAARTRIAELSRTIDALDAQVQARVEAIDRLRTTIDGLHATIASLRAEDASRQENLALLRRELEDIRASKSWRWTGPVRTLLARLGWQ
jgi:FtsZ-binding cell division protein ZapB